MSGIGVSLNTNLGFPGSVGGSVSLGFNGGGVTVGVNVGTPGGQSFQTIPLPNNQLALYRIVIRAPSGAQAAVASWTFPLSPSSINKEIDEKNMVWDVQGQPGQGGVLRVADLYGQAPVTYLIEGTTGWQQHATDGFQFTGLQSIAAIQTALTQFASLNATQVANNNSNLYTMEFYDYFTGQFWQVVPIGKQVIRQDDSKPLLFFYSFRFAAIQSLSQANSSSIVDQVLNTLTSSVNQALTSVSTSLGISLNGYAGVTLGSTGINIGVSL